MLGFWSRWSDGWGEACAIKLCTGKANAKSARDMETNDRNPIREALGNVVSLHGILANLIAFAIIR